MWREKLLLDIAWGKVVTHVFTAKWKIFEVSFYRCRKFLQLRVQMSLLLKYRNANRQVAGVFIGSSIL